MNAAEAIMTPEDLEEAGRQVAEFRSQYAGTLYAIKAGNFIKFGFTRGDIATRMVQLQTGCPMPLRLLGTGSGGRFLERRIHSILRSFCAHGEWFRDEPTVRHFVQQFCPMEC